MRTIYSLLLSTALLLPVTALAEPDVRPSIKGVELGMTLDEMVAALAEHGFVQKADMLDLQGANVAVGDIRGHYTEINSGQDGLGPSKRWGFRVRTH